MANKYADDANFYKEGLQRVIKEKQDEQELIDLFNEPDPVERPSHYTNKQIEVIDYIDDTVPDCYSFYFGNALKYLSRHLNKGKPKQDLQKCIWYIKRMIKDNKE